VPLQGSFRRLYELADKKLATMEGMFTLGVGDEWFRRLFAWDEELVRECVGWLTSVVLQVGLTIGFDICIHLIDILLVVLTTN